jgi:hypothetical protein
LGTRRCTSICLKKRDTFSAVIYTCDLTTDNTAPLYDDRCLPTSACLSPNYQIRSIDKRAVPRQHLASARVQTFDKCHEVSYLSPRTTWPSICRIICEALYLEKGNTNSRNHLPINILCFPCSIFTLSSCAKTKISICAQLILRSSRTRHMDWIAQSRTLFQIRSRKSVWMHEKQTPVPNPLMHSV